MQCRRVGTTMQTITLNNDITLPALGVGVFQAQPKDVMGCNATFVQR